MATLSLCEEYFGTRDIYQLLEVPKDALPKDIKKAYYKLSLKVHPDRVSAEDKEKATEKFKVLSKIYQTLEDKDKRALYDEQGVIDDDDDMESKLSSWLELWRKIFKPLTEEDITNYMNSYVGSELERTDMKKSYLAGKGCINQMMNEVPFLKVEDEPRLQKIIGDMIAAGDVPEYKIFTREPAAKRNRRHKKYSRESKEAEELKAQLYPKSDAAASAAGNSLEQQIMSRNQARETGFNSLMDKLMAKYGNEDDEESLDLDDLGKSSRKKKKTAPKANGQKQKPAVKTGKVNKKRK